MSPCLSEQLEDRHIYKYPPFCRIIKLTIKHKDYNKVNQGVLSG